ncbi:histidine kinase [Streptomyces sp. NPDC050617]|uniref:sensor histidine kinase n=1 Tax=Streptomyces sp. NPDC050617 TaxID=3154628 RepID=UPI00342E7D2C
MNDTYQRPNGANSEIRVARGVFHTIREDLVTDAFAFRPVPPLADDHPLLRFVPQKAVGYARWLPHAVFLAAAFLLTFMPFMGFEPGLSGLLGMLATGVPLAVVLLRPLGAWWLALAAAVPMALLSGFQSFWPWTPTGVVSYGAVMLIAAFQLRPRASAGMWGITVAFIVVLGIPFRGHVWTRDTLALLIVFGALLLVMLGLRGVRESKQQVAVQAAVTEVERSRRTVLEERTTIARELHDVVAHHMSVVAIQAEAAPYRVEETPPELAAAFATIRENAVSALTELRRVLGVVRSENPEAFGEVDPEAPQPTLAALGSLIDNVRAAGLTVEHVTTGVVRTMPQGVELSAYRIVQEALSNTLRHAPGAEARVEVSYVMSGLGLRIVNGPANRLAKPSPGSGHGMLGMRERVTMLSGEMTAGATKDGGFEVVAFIPVEAAEESE